MNLVVVPAFAQRRSRSGTNLLPGISTLKKGGTAVREEDMQQLRAPSITGMLN